MPTNAPRLASYTCVFATLFVLTGACLDRPVAPATPNVTARFREDNSQTAVSKIDLLFMIDNSASMADKQQILGEAIPDLVNRLVDPICVNPDGSDSTAKPDPSTGRCPAPTLRDFDPVKDIHVGIITSSLGSHGAPGVCDGAKDTGDMHNADMSHLIARNGTAMVQTFQNLGFLNWNPGLSGAYSDATKLKDDFRTMVTGVGQHGCGYEAQLEAVYRFLVDPAPYKTITLADQVAIPHDVDDVVLKQRADFLRPDSLVAVIVVTDENDYSFIDGGQGWAAAALVENRPLMKAGTTACLTNPNDRCCVNCNEADVSGCTPHAADPRCANPLTNETDPPNTRASRSKLQYGYDFNWPIERYIEGFTQPTLDEYGGGAKNPLFNDANCGTSGKCAPRRPAELFFLAGIIGVPWQDIARDPTDLSKGFLNASELAKNGTWSVILGDPKASPPVPPTDPHMIVSPTPRAGIAGPTSAPGADPKNGHEWNTPTDPSFADLQYACTFRLTGPHECLNQPNDCDCRNGATTMNPLCQTSAGAYGTMQFGAKAYPGLRELELLKGLGEQGIVGSICPSNTDDMAKADYGYRPAIAALVARLRGVLRGRCLPRSLAADGEGHVSCVILEVFDPKPGEDCRCDGDKAVPGRRAAAADVLAATPNLDSYGSCKCELTQLDGTERASCMKDATPNAGINGWCYVDPGQSRDAAQCELVKNCGETKKRLIRYVGEQPRGTNVIICQEQSFGGEPPKESVCH